MERLNPRVRIVWAVGALVTALVLGGIVAGVALFADTSALPWFTPVYGVAASLLVGIIGVVFAVRRYRVFRFEVREDTLFLQRGVVTRVRTVVPYVRVQHVDTQRGPLERLVGLSSVVVYTAGSRGADVSIPGLTPERADELQASLRELAIESEPEDAV
ncbi:PH domain-containing protein [Salarchaeum sp. JOR-1]|uniref:PH domain-containing protein n=1 Tax=Salarchaeum sp. JOR-1 TaxID=2599399 RepID=UPI0011985292|nr:PH domain-containing protein [Salarchaeum sp. JOR-1]QDX41100.1 PH domain-containing protein [Salarchaeum sp. JOR-1]